MMSHCDACNKEGDFSFSIQVHSFPKDAQMRKQWIQAVQNVIEGWTPKEDSVLCSKHFEESCYKEPDPVLGKAGMMCRGLKDSAVPTIFKTSKKKVLVQNHKENGRLRSAEMQTHLATDGQEASSREEIVTCTANDQAKEELHPRSPSTNSQHQSIEKMDIDVGTMSNEGLSARCDKEDSHEQRENQGKSCASELEMNRGVFFDGDLNFPLWKVFEQIAKIKEEWVKRVAVDQDRRQRKDKWWCSVSQDFRTNLETYTQRLEVRRSNIPVTFDPSMPSTLSILGDSQETVKLREELTVPCLGKMYSPAKALCPRCGIILDGMMKIVNHMCKAKRKSLESGKFGVIPDVVFVKDKKWKRLQRIDVSKPPKKTKRQEVIAGLADDIQDAHRLSDGPSPQNRNKTKTKLKKGTCSSNLWKKLKLKQKSEASSKKSRVMKKKEKKKKKKKRREKKYELPGHFRALKMFVQARSDCKSFLEQSLDKNVKEMREMERRSTLGELTKEDATDLLFADLSEPGFVSVKKEPGNLQFTVQSGVGQSEDQTLADRVSVPKVYPVSIIPSSLLLTNLNTAPCPESNDSMDLDDKSLARSQMGLLPDPSLSSPVQYENRSGGVEGGGVGIRLSDGTLVKTEPMDHDR